MRVFGVAGLAPSGGEKEGGMGGERGDRAAYTRAHSRHQRLLIDLLRAALEYYFKACFTCKEPKSYVYTGCFWYENCVSAAT